MLAKFRTLLALLSAVSLLGGFASHTEAAIYAVTLSGTVTQVDAALNGRVAEGDTLSTTYLFDTAIEPRAGATLNDAVYDSLLSLAFSAGTISASTTGAPEIQVSNDPDPMSGDHDRYAVVARASDGLTEINNAMFPALLAAPGLVLDSFILRLDDFDNTAFSTALTLPTSLNVPDFELNFFFLTFVGNTAIQPGPLAAPSSFLASGVINSITFTPQNAAVPEPASLVIWAGLGLAGLVARNRRK